MQIQADGTFVVLSIVSMNMRITRDNMCVRICRMYHQLQFMIHTVKYFQVMFFSTCSFSGTYYRKIVRQPVTGKMSSPGKVFPNPVQGESKTSDEEFPRLTNATLIYKVHFLAVSK